MLLRTRNRPVELGPRTRSSVPSAWRLFVTVAALLTTSVACAVVAQPAAAAPTLTLKLAPPAIVADGRSTTTATLQVIKAGGLPALKDQVTFSSNAGQVVGPTTNHSDGTYSATITSTKVAGNATITARDVTRSASAQVTLTQIPGPAAQITVQVAPRSILADGASNSTITATVTDAFGNPVAGAPVVFTASDRGVGLSAPTNNGDGTYTSTLRSSTTPGTVRITATLTSTGASAATTLNQAGRASVMSVSAAPPTAVTNQIVTLIAVVTAPGSNSAPQGTISFANNGTPIPGCTSEPALPRADQQLSQGTCQVTFGSSTSQQQITASFTSSSSLLADSSAAAVVAVQPGNTFTSLDVSNPSVNTGATATFTAHVAPANIGSIGPSGSVAFFDAGQPIAACAREPLTIGLMSSTATCSVTYPQAGQHGITARYGGDANFNPSASPSPQPVTVHTRPPRVVGTINATMQWTFVSAPTYTTVRAFVVNQVPIGATITVMCRGGGCPFAKHVNSRKMKGCKSATTSRCSTRGPATVNLQRPFENRSLGVGARIVVKITRPKWIGKYYLFTVRAGRPPVVRIDCLAPGGSRPGVGC